MIGGAAAGVFSDAIWREPTRTSCCAPPPPPPPPPHVKLSVFICQRTQPLCNQLIGKTASTLCTTYGERGKKWRFWHWILCKPNAVTLYQAAENLPNLPLISRYLTRAKTIAGIWKGWVGLERGMEYIFLSQHFTAEKKEKKSFLFLYNDVTPNCKWYSGNL